MNNTSSASNNLYEDAVDREDLARSNIMNANIYRNLLLQERDENERTELRIGLRKAIVLICSLFHSSDLFVVL